jgi:DNA-damage-inducible protein J
VVQLGYILKERLITVAKTGFIRARVDERLKTNTEDLFGKLGLTMTEAITLFLSQCEMRQGLPFEVSMPNEETQKALEDARSGDVQSFDTLEDLFEDLGI